MATHLDGGHSLNELCPDGAGHRTLHLRRARHLLIGNKFPEHGGTRADTSLRTAERGSTSKRIFASVSARSQARSCPLSDQQPSDTASNWYISFLVLLIGVALVIAQTASENGSSEEDEVVCRREDGSSRWLLTNVEVNKARMPSLLCLHLPNPGQVPKCNGAAGHDAAMLSWPQADTTSLATVGGRVCLLSSRENKKVTVLKRAHSHLDRRRIPVASPDPLAPTLTNSRAGSFVWIPQWVVHADGKQFWWP